MACKSKPCNVKKSEIENSGKNIEWTNYPSPNEKKFGNGKFCYFYSCRDVELPLRDYVKKKEPCYENQSYNEFSKCNQNIIKNAEKNGISYIIFFTKYQGNKKSDNKDYRNGYFITGLFPISATRKVQSRIAIKSDSSIFLSITDSIELNEKVWKEWFNEKFPTDKKRRNHNGHYMRKRLNKNDTAMKAIRSHFEEKKI